MSETWKFTREGFRNIRRDLAAAPVEARIDFWWWVIATTGMFGCIIWAFGWPGAWFGIFCAIKHSIERKK